MGVMREKDYDTPVQEAYINGYREEITGFTRSLLNATFKTNPYMERAVLTGINRNKHSFRGSIRISFFRP